MDLHERAAEILGGISMLVLIGYGGWIGIASMIRRASERRSTKTARMDAIENSRIPREPWSR